MNIFFITKGLSPVGQSFPPSKLKPNPAPSLTRTKVEGGSLEELSAIHSLTEIIILKI